MPTLNNYLDDRSNLPAVIYVEDSPDWVIMWGFPDIVKKGLDQTVSWYKKVDHALLALVKEECLEEAQQYIQARVTDYRDEPPSPDEILTIAGFIDPERLRNRIIILDNQVPGWLFGMDLIEAVICASQTLGENEKPRIVSLMCSDPTIIENKPDIFSRWDTNGIEVIHKDHYPFFAFWIGQVIRGEKTRFRDWLEEATDIKYAERMDHANEIKTKHTNLSTVLDYLRDDSDESHRGILVKIRNSEVVELIARERLNFREVPQILEGWNAITTQSEAQSPNTHPERCT